MSVAMIENTSMPEPWQCQPADLRGVSDLMEVEVRVCDNCGVVGREELLAICTKCTDGAQHTYCMRVKLDKVPEGDWTCEECILRTDTMQDKVEEAVRISKGRLEYQKSGSSVNVKLRSSLVLKSRSLCIGGSGKDAACSVPPLSAKRHAATLEAQAVKKPRTIRMSAVSPRSTNPSTSSLLHRGFSCHNFKKEKMKAAVAITSVLQSSCNCQEKARVPRACGDKRNAGTFEAELHKKEWTLETTVTFPGVNKPSNHSLPNTERPFKFLEKKQKEPSNNVTSLEQSSYCTQKKSKLPSILGDKAIKLGPQTGTSWDKRSPMKSKSFNSADLKMEQQRTKCGYLQKQKVAIDPAFHDNRKGKNHRMVFKSLSFNGVSSNKSNATASEVLSANASCPETLKKLSLAEETQMEGKGNDTSKGDYMSKLHNLAICTPSDPGISMVTSKEDTTSCSGTSVLGSTSNKLDIAVHSCEQSDYRPKPSSHFSHKDLNCPNEKKKKESWQAQHPKEAATSGDRSHLRNLPLFEAAIPYPGSVIPVPNYTWLGKFQVHSSKKPIRIFPRIQANLSICASPKVLKVVERLPKTIVLEEVPCSVAWLSQCMRSHATENNIAVYFFAKDVDSHSVYYERLVKYTTENDLALKGNIDDVELLIFPSRVLPEKSQRWNAMFFLWGVFRGRKVGSSANKSVSNSGTEEHRESERVLKLDLNALPEDVEDTARIDDGNKQASIDNCLHDIHKSDRTGARSSGGKTLLGGDDYSSGSPHPREALTKEGEGVSKPEVPDLNLPLQPNGATSVDGLGASVGIMDDKTNQEMHGEPPMENETEANNGEPSGSHSLSLPSLLLSKI